MVAAAPLPVIVENIPLTLREGKRFVAWRPEDRKGQPKPAKMPYSPDAPKGASSTAPADWTTFKDALAYAEVAGLAGIMRAFDPSDGLVGVDLDNCRDPETGELAPWAADIVRRLDTYTEVSPSGTGVKLWLYGTLPPHGRKRGDREMYDRGRFFTMTGHQLAGTPSLVGHRPDALLAIHRETFGDAPPNLTTAADVDPDRAVSALETADDEVLRLASTSQHNGERFCRLWDGDSSDYASGGNDGESEADAALFEILGFYGGPDPEKIERIARRSNRVREKWDRQKDYLPRSITFAIQGKTRFYGDSIQTPAPASGSDGTSVCNCPTCPARARVTHLERALLDRDDFVESIQTCNGTLSRELTRIQELRALDRRMELDKQRLRRKLKPMQAESLIAVATIGPSIANSAGIAAPYVTREAIAQVAGGKPSTVGANLQLLEYPGSPVQRTTVNKGMKSLTAYDFAGMDTPDLLRALADFAEGLEAPPKLTPERVRCDRCAPGTTQTVATICDGCSKVLAKRHLPGPNVQENSTLAGGPGPTVSVRTYRAGKQHVAGSGFQRADKQRVAEPGAGAVLQPGWLDQWPGVLIGAPPDDLGPPPGHEFDIPEAFRQ